LQAQFSDLTNGRVTFAGTSGALVDSANLTFNSGTNTLTVTNATVGTQANLASAAIQDITATHVMFAGAGGEVTGDADLTWNAGTDTLTAKNISVVTEATLASAIVSDLTATRVVFAGTSGALVDDDVFTYNSTTDTLSVPNVSMTGDLSVANLTVTSLTPTRVVFVGASDELVDDADLTFTAGSNTLNLVNMNITGSVTGDLVPAANEAQDLGSASYKWRDLYLSGSSIELGTQTITSTASSGGADRGSISFSGDFSTYAISATNITNSALTSGRITFAGASGLLDDDAELTYDASNNEISVPNINVGAQATLASAAISDIDATHVMFAGTAGEVTGNAAMTFDSGSGTLAITNVDASDVEAITASLGSINFAGDTISTTSGDIQLDAFSGIIDVSSNTISNLATPTAGTDAATKQYVDDSTNAIDALAIAGDTGTGSVDLETETLTIAGTANEIDTVVSGQTVTVSLPDNIHVDVTGDLTGNVTGQVSDIGNHSIAELNDVDITGIADNDVIRWNASASTFEASPLSGFTMRRQRFTANGSSGSFTLNVAPESRDYLIVTVSGVPQQGDTYSVAGTTLTLGGTPQAGEVVEVLDFSLGVFSPAPNSTDDIAEGSTNKYYSNTLVSTFLGNGTLNTNIIPATDITYDLGSASKRWRDLYLSGNTIHLGSVRIKDQGGAIKFVDSNGDPYPVDLGVTLDSDVQIDGGSF